MRLGAQYRAIGVLESVWRLGYECGDPHIGTAEDVEYAIGWDGEPGACIAALCEAGFLEAVDGELSIHDLQDHEPSYVKSRRRMERMRSNRREQDSPPPKPERNSYATVTQQSRECCPTPAPAPTPTPLEQTNVQPSKQKEMAESFGRWYALYQRHEAKKDAETAWRNLTAKERAECEQMTPAWFAARPGMERRFVPLPATFLRARRWTDDPPPLTDTEQRAHAREQAETAARREAERKWQEDAQRAEEQRANPEVVKRMLAESLMTIGRGQQPPLDVNTCLHPSAGSGECELCWIGHPRLHATWQTRANCVANTRRNTEPIEGSNQ